MSQSEAGRIRPGDVVSFRFPYSEGIAPYARPSLVLEATEDELLLAYGTTSRERANVGFEIRLNDEFAACGLVRESRFVLARRVRVPRTDPRLEVNVSGTPVLGRLTDELLERKRLLMVRIAASWEDEASRIRAERRGLHPGRGRRRRRAGHPYRV